jgi:hypothetical protein
MNLYTKKKILVIGSINHPLADKCISWKEMKSLPDKIPYLGDFHVLIINLQTLLESDLDEKMKKVFDKMREEINEIILENTEIICITAPTIKMKLNNLFIPNYDSISNYDWCPFNLYFTKKEGESFGEKEILTKFFPFTKKYSKHIKKWSYFLEKYDLGKYKPQKRKYVDMFILPLLTNLANKPLAFEVTCEEYDTVVSYVRNEEMYEKINKICSQSILFLPPTTEISIEEAIDYLLEEIRGVTKESVLPKWTENIKIYGEEELLKKIKEAEELKRKLENELEKYKLELSELVKFKKLLTTNGEELENIVEETFKLLGVEVKNGPKGKEDKIIIDPDTNSEIPVEITGAKYSIPEKKLNQLIGRLVDEERIEKIKCKCQGILIGNHYKEIELKERGRPFEPEVIKKAEVSKICLLSTSELLKAVNAKLSGEEDKIKKFIKAIFNTPGEILFEE